MDDSPSGIGTLVFFSLIVGLIMTGVTGWFSIWLLLIPGLLVGLLAAASSH